MTATGTVALADTTAQVRAARSGMAGRVAVVMTMGALHAGHADLLRAARGAADHVIATIFVNPLQFGPAEDLDRYPRSLEHDLEVCRAEGVDLVFAPPAEQLYPSGPPQVRVEPGPLATILEGAARPGHFEGVLTVVLKLLHLSQPTTAYFGEKDYQQLTLIRHMVADLDVGVRVVAVPTRREPDGLALSSRNRYLTPAQRAAALRLSAALRAGQAAAAGGADAAAVRRAGWAVLTSPDSSTEDVAELVPDYLELTDPDLGVPPRTGPARLLVAARVGTTRLIDNVAVELLC